MAPRRKTSWVTTVRDASSDQKTSPALIRMKRHIKKIRSEEMSPENPFGRKDVFRRHARTRTQRCLLQKTHSNKKDSPTRSPEDTPGRKDVSTSLVRTKKASPEDVFGEKDVSRSPVRTKRHLRDLTYGTWHTPPLFHFYTCRKQD